MRPTGVPWTEPMACAPITRAASPMLQEPGIEPRVSIGLRPGIVAGSRVDCQSGVSSGLLQCREHSLGLLQRDNTVIGAVKGPGRYTSQPPGPGGISSAADRGNCREALGAICRQRPPAV